MTQIMITNGGKHTAQQWAMTTADMLVDASADALESVLYITDHTEWRNHFRKDEVQNALQEIIARHFCSAQLIERQWYASDNPDCPHVQVFNQASIDKGII